MIAAASHADTELSVPSPFPPVLCDPQAFEQIFSNLFSNSLVYAATGVKPVIHVGCTVEDSTAEITVRDKGFDTSFKGIYINACYLFYYLPINIQSLHLPGMDEISFLSSFLSAFLPAFLPAFLEHRTHLPTCHCLNIYLHINLTLPQRPPES